MAWLVQNWEGIMTILNAIGLVLVGSYKGKFK